MSELYMIVMQGKEELGNDPEAIRLWAELSGVDIDSINEHTPFDIEVADRLLRTLPEVMERMRERARKDVESLEESLKKVLESKQRKTEAEELLQKLDRELSEARIIPEAEEEKPEEEVDLPPAELPFEPVGVPKEELPPKGTPAMEYETVEEPVDVRIPELVRLLRMEGNKIYVLKGDWPTKYASLLPSLTNEAVRRFHLLLKNGNILYGERVDDSYIVAEFEERNLGIVKLLYTKVLKALSLR